eukprot:CAMPEP_0182863490 /NCGR_PEP_ID=MMETSP0034_2-20130328/6672_1 /TAXON_ID=156128 /ORGANISM="Nephroselmis pyriformis, Strain CCMP717" /LENGTH=114 /DNA_ID=CAMNT_0024995701 /DNA_START=204 /DNA_END=548 /DNA_ORIENTATION=-
MRPAAVSTQGGSRGLHRTGGRGERLHNEVRGGVDPDASITLEVPGHKRLAGRRLLVQGSLHMGAETQLPGLAPGPGPARRSFCHMLFILKGVSKWPGARVLTAGIGGTVSRFRV